MSAKYKQYKNQYQCYACGKIYSSFHQLAGHLSQCEEYREYKEYGIEDAPFYKLPGIEAKRQKWKRYWMNRSPEDRKITLAKRKILTRKIQESKRDRGDE